MSGLFAYLVLILMSNQVATGLALTIFGIGLSSMIGKKFIGTPIQGLNPYFFIALSFVIVFGVSYFFYKTKMGLIFRAVGESHSSAHALGYSVIKIRLLGILFGGAMCALAGSYMSICYAPMWQENMTSGRGWIALALVVFATWKPNRILIGAYIFGGVSIMQMNLQAFGLSIPGQFFNMAPYLATMIVLVLISSNKLRIKMSAPASLTKPFYKGR
jgi:simple sugar transport system permease protein